VKQRAGRSQPVGLLVVGELAEQVVRGWQIRNRAARRSRWVQVVGLDLGRVADVVRVPSLCSESILDVQPALDLVTRGQLRDCEGVSPLQPGSPLLIRDT